MITHISFDLDGTLEFEEFDTIVWNEEIPKLYAQQHGVTLEQAKERVYAEYYRAQYLEKIPNWTDIGYWFDRFGLMDWQKLLDDMRERIMLFDDALEALEYARSKYQTVMISSAEERFLHLKLESTGIEPLFDKIISTSKHYGMWSKDREAFRRALDELSIQPEQMVHVGNSRTADFEAPKALGIKAYLLDRSGKLHGEYVIHSLHELKEKI